MSDIVERLGRRIHNQRARLRYWEELFNEHVHAHLHALHPRHLMKAIELGNENFRLRQLLSEAETREREARVKALEEAALWHDAKVREYTDQIAVNDAYLARSGRLSSESRANEYCDDMRSCHRRAAAAFRALQSEER